MSLAPLTTESFKSRESAVSQGSILDAADGFEKRHLGSLDVEQLQMLQTLGFSTLDELSDQTVPADIQLRHPLKIEGPMGEREALQSLAMIAEKNKVYRSCIGM